MSCPFISRFHVIFSKLCEKGEARDGTKQRLQVMTHLIHAAVVDWKQNHPDATLDEKLRLDLGYVTFQVQQKCTLEQSQQVMFNMDVLI